MEYESSLKSIGNIGKDIEFDTPSLQVPFEQGITNTPPISWKQGIAFKPKFVKWTLATGEKFWAPENHDINPN